MSTHIFKVSVECDSADDYERTVSILGSLGEIVDEENDFSG